MPTIEAFLPEQPEQLREAVNRLTDAELEQRIQGLEGMIGTFASDAAASAYAESPLKSTMNLLPKSVESAGCPIPPMGPGCNVSFSMQ